MTTDTDTTATAQPSEALVATITAALGRVLKRDLGQVDTGTRLFDDLGLDSTSVLELLMELENDLGVEFDADTLEQHHFATVSSLAGYLHEQMGA